MLSSILEVTPQQELLIVILGTILAWALGVFGRRWTSPRILESVRGNPWLAPLYAFLLVLVLRGVLQPALGTPPPKVHDEFSYLLLSDTFSHFRLTNLTPVAWQHFETFQVNMFPTYHSKYPIGPGLVMAVGQVLFASPWMGVYLSTAVMAGAICWALEAFVSSSWALVGGVLAALHLGIVSYWMNSYWGGSLTALGGALCLGATARLIVRPMNRRQSTLLGLALGFGISILGTTRPFEGAMFFLPLSVWIAWNLLRDRHREGYRQFLRGVATAASVVLATLVFLAYYNHRTTGSALLMPYSLYERTYSFTPLFLWGRPQASPVYRHPLMGDFYSGWVFEFYHVTRTWDGLIYSEQIRRIQLWLFFIGAILSIPFLVGIASALWNRRTRILLWCAVTTFIAYSAGVFFQPHYFAPATVTIYAFIVLGLRAMWRSRWPLLRSLSGTLCAAGMAFTLIEANHTVYIEYPTATNRQLVSDWVASFPGKHLIVVDYANGHETHHELVFNTADMPSAKILWARKMTPELDTELCIEFPDRTIWTLLTDDHRLAAQPSSLCKNARTAGQ